MFCHKIFLKVSDKISKSHLLGCFFSAIAFLCVSFVDEVTVTRTLVFCFLKEREKEQRHTDAEENKRQSMQTSQQQQQLDVTRRRFVQAVLQPGPTEPVIEEVPEAASASGARESSGDDAYDDQPEVFAMDADDNSSGSSSDAGTATTSPTRPMCPLPQRPQQQQPQQPEFMPSIAVSDRRSSSRLSVSSSVCSSAASSAALSLSRSGMGHSVVPTLTPPLSSYARCGEDFGADDDDDGTTVVIAPHDVTAAISQPRVAASFGFVPPHLVADIPEY